ncbi:hypothetical protein BKA62DRAFT_771620 [Auriculariales sp. MPI-PUGE-AT-0066]|nr:hypothetical protein BKA62DRAFT_771620 [Auriculariales sp. MPI-PUGE-AT-0066]
MGALTTAILYVQPPSAANDYEGMLKTSDGSTITGKFTDPGVSLSKFVWLTVTIKGATNVDVISSCNLGENLNMELVEQALKFTMSAKGEGIFY